MTALGIDLGTTYSVVATLDERGRPVVVRNPLDEETTPSVVWFDGTSAVVGSAARNAAAAFPDRTVSMIKRLMGVDRTLTFDGREFTPEAISSLILRALLDGALPGRDQAEAVRAVVTVPAYFGIREREATQQACLLAGLQPLELISEPVAAAIHYGFSETVGIGTTIVFDFGGGTFDATIMDMGTRIEVIATDGDVELGGTDFDERLVRLLLDRFTEQAAPGRDPGDDALFMTELTLTAERLKRTLSTTTAHRVPLRFDGHAVTVAIGRDEFETASRDLVDTALACVSRLLKVAKAKGASEIDHCLLVGGSTKMPMIAAALTERFGWRPRLFDPDLAVAKGAALRAHQLQRLPVAEQTWKPSAGDRPDVGYGSASIPTPPVRPQPQSADATPVGEPVFTVVPHSIGVVVHDSHDRAGTRRFVHHMVHQNDPLPAVGRATLATILPNQAGFRVELYEQAGAVESAELGDNRAVLDGEITDLTPGRPAGTPIELTLTVDTDGRLVLAAAEPGSGRVLAIEACIEGVVDGAERDRAYAALMGLTVRV